MKQAKSGIVVASALAIGGLFGQVAYGGDMEGSSRQATPYQSESSGDTSAEQKTMGYGTDGIVQEVDSYSLGNRSNLGAPDSFAGLDRDGDGFVSRQEGQGLGEKQWRESDLNGDGKLDPAEFSAFEGTAAEDR